MPWNPVPRFFRGNDASDTAADKRYHCSRRPWAEDSCSKLCQNSLMLFYVIHFKVEGRISTKRVRRPGHGLALRTVVNRTTLKRQMGTTAVEKTTLCLFLGDIYSVKHTWSHRWLNAGLLSFWTFKQSSKQSSQLNQYTNNSKHQQLQLHDST